MNYTWQTLRASDGLIETVDAWPTLDAVLAEIAASNWEEPSNRWLSFVVDEAGQVVAVALFGPGLELMVIVSDGRCMRHPVPAFYREHGIGQPEPHHEETQRRGTGLPGGHP